MERRDIASNQPILKGDEHEQDVEARHAGTEVRSIQEPGNGQRSYGSEGKAIASDAASGARLYAGRPHQAQALSLGESR